MFPSTAFLKTAAIAIPTAALLFALFSTLRVRVALAFRFPELRIALTVRWMFGLTVFDRVFLLRYEPDRGLVLYKVKHGVPLRTGRRRRRRLKPKPALIPALARAISIERLRCRGEIGLADDAAASCLLCGGLGDLLNTAASSAFAALRFARLPSGRVFRFTPVFEKNAFHFELDGIVAAIPAKLIKNLIGALLPGKE